MKDKKWFQSKKFICYLITTVLLFALAFFMAFQGQPWAAVVCAAMDTAIGSVLILGQASTERLAGSAADIIAALRGGERLEEEEVR